MAVREFDGTDDYIRMAVGGVAISNFAQGNYTMVAVVKPTTMANTEPVIGVQVSNTSLKTSLGFDGSNQVAMTDDNNVYGSTCNPSTTSWNIIALRKATGTTQTRGSCFVFGGSWTHASNASSIAGVSGTPDRIEIGAFLVGSGFQAFKDCRLAVAAVFNADLTNGNLDTISGALTTQSIYNLTPLALWDFNQASTGTAVDDLIGSSDQSSLVGTTVVTTDDPPSWVFGVGGGPAVKAGAGVVGP